MRSAHRVPRGPAQSCTTRPSDNANIHTRPPASENAGTWRRKRPEPLSLGGRGTRLRSPGRGRFARLDHSGQANGPCVRDRRVAAAMTTLEHEAAHVRVARSRHAAGTSRQSRTSTLNDDRRHNIAANVDLVCAGWQRVLEYHPAVTHGQSSRPSREPEDVVVRQRYVQEWGLDLGDVHRATVDGDCGRSSKIACASAAPKLGLACAVTFEGTALD